MSTRNIGQNLFTIGIAFLALGGFGGSLQPSRLAIIAFLLLALTSISSLRVNRSQPFLATYICYTGILLAGALAIFGAVDIAGVGLYLTVMLGMATILMPNTSQISIQHLHKVQSAWGLSLFLSIPFSAYELATGNHFTYAMEERNVGGEFGELMYAAGFFGNINNYSLYLCLGFPFLLSATQNANSVWRRLLFFSTIIFTIAILLINGSRVAIAFISLYTFIWLITQPKLAIPLALISAAIAALYREDLQVYADLVAYKISNTGTGDESTTMRAEIIQGGINLLMDTGGYGSGMGSFRSYLSENYPSLIPNAHNFILELSVNFTIFAALAFCAWLTILYVTALRLKSLSLNDRLPCLISIPAMPILGIINSEALGYTYWWYWFSSIVVCLSVNATSTEVPPSVNR